MAIEKLAFTPTQGYRDSTFAQTDPASEAALRDTMQDIPDQIRDYINDTLTVEIDEANTKADNAVSTADAANTSASTAVTTANSANTKADASVSTANTASANASAAVTTANSAVTIANAASNTATTAQSTATTAQADAAASATSAAAAQAAVDLKVDKSYVDTLAANFVLGAVPDGTITIPKLSFNPATQAELDAVSIVANAAETPAGAQAKADVVQENLNTHSADYVRQPAFGQTTGGTGTPNAYIFTSTPALPALVDGVSAYLDINLANTGASTLNWDGTGAKAIVDSKGNALVAGKLPLSGIVGVRYNSSTGNFQLLGEGGEYGTAGAAQTLTGYSIGTPTGLVNGTMPNKVGSAMVINPSTVDQAVPQGYTDGAMGSIKVSKITMVAGDVMISSSGANSFSGSESSYTKRAHYTCTYAGVVRVKFQLAAITGTAYGRIYKNGIAVGTERMQNVNSWLAFTEDISINAGDTIELWLYNTSGTYNSQQFYLYASYAFVVYSVP